MTAKRKRPKVRYVVASVDGKDAVVRKLNRWPFQHVVGWGWSLPEHRRIAAAMNLYEATKRGEI